MNEDKLRFTDQAWDGTPALAPRIKGSEKMSVIGAWIGVGFFAFVFYMMVLRMGMPFLIPPKNFPNPIACILGLLLGGMLLKALWETMRLQRFGDPVLELNEGRGMTGGTLDGRITFGREITGAPEFVIRLECRHVVKQPGTNKMHITSPWSGEQRTTMLPGGVLPISIAVPADQPPTDESDPFDRIYWELRITAPFKPVGFSEKYEVPVLAGQGASLSDVRETSTINLRQAQTFKRGFFFLFFIPVLIAGLVVLYDASRDLSHALKAANWPTAEGKITASRAVVSGRKSASYEPRVNYTYMVNGVTHASSLVYPHWFWSRAATQKVITQFQTGQAAAIHYDPDHPESAMLLPGAQRGAFQGVIVAGLVLSLALLLGVACFAPAGNVIQRGNSISYRAGTMESKLSGFAVLGIIALAVGLWWVA